MSNQLFILAIAAVLVGLLFLAAAVSALNKRRLIGMSASLLLALLLLTWAGVFGLVAVGMRGYQAFMHEEVAALVEIEPLAPGRFVAEFRFLDGSREHFRLAGDQLYVDAHILKWTPFANFLGLHTAYKLDRVAGRYSRLADEQTKERTVYSLASRTPLDLFELRRQYRFFHPLLDAEYGSATFAAAEGAQRFELRVSTSGLLIRHVGGPQ